MTPRSKILYYLGLYEKSQLTLDLNFCSGSQQEVNHLPKEQPQ